MKPTPILFISDNPAMPTGLARITKDLAVLTSQLPEFRVGVMGRGGTSSARLPFAQFPFPEEHQWGEAYIEGVWEDFAASECGIIMTIWDLSRLDWFARPKMGGTLETFLKSGRFQKWGYIPVDSYGVGRKLTGISADACNGFNRLLAYSLFGKQILEDTLGREMDWIPHGYNEKVFQPRDPAAGRMTLGVSETDRLIGCVMTNQSRKDWGTAFGAMARLARLHDVKFWIHIDVPVRYWNLFALLEDFGLVDKVVVTYSGSMTSEQLSYLYSACNVTILPSLGEGWGFPITESLACGVPVIHGNYGGGVEQIPMKDWLVEVQGERLDGVWNQVRPVWNPVTWAEKIEHVLNQYGDGMSKEICTRAVEHLRWSNLYPSCWKKWFLAGIDKCC